MEEMVEAHGGGVHQDWKFLEELLACYLRINGKTSHGYIVGAFVDLLVELFMDQSLAHEADDEADTINIPSSSSSSMASSSSSSSFTSSSNTYSHCLLSSSSSSSSSSTTTHSFTSPLSFGSSLSLLEEEAEDETEKSIHNASSSSSSPPHFAWIDSKKKINTKYNILYYTGWVAFNLYVYVDISLPSYSVYACVYF